MRRHFSGLLLVAWIGLGSVGTIRAWLAPQAVQHSSGCRALNWTPLAATETGYSEARAVAAKLSAIGVSVGCIAPSKMANWFEGQEGAAVFDTDVGRFDILFLPSEQTFDELRIVQREADGWFFYVLEGLPRWRIPRMESPRRVYFSTHGNKLVVTQEEEVMLRIVNALGNR